MEFFVHPGTYAGAPYLPDEIAKKLVAELNLKDGDTVSKDQIVDHLQQNGCGALWAADVAAVLRNMFGVTPTFFESKSPLAAELSSLLESKQDDVSNSGEADYAMAFGTAVDEVFNSATSEEDALIVAALSQESLETVAAIGTIDEFLSESAINEAVAVYAAGGDDLVEAWLEVTARPHMIRFVGEDIIEAINEAIGGDVRLIAEAISPEEQSRRKLLKMKAAGFNPQNDDPLAAKSNDGGQYSKFIQNKDAAAKRAGNWSPDAKHGQGWVRKQLAQATDRMNSTKPMPLPQDPAKPAAPQPKPVMHRNPDDVDADEKARGFKAQRDAAASPETGAFDKFGTIFKGPEKPGLARKAIGAMGHIVNRIKAHAASAPAGQQAQQPGQGMGSRIWNAAKGIGASIGNKLKDMNTVAKAHARMRHPGLTGFIHGAPDDAEMAYMDRNRQFFDRAGAMGQARSSFQKTQRPPATMPYRRRGTI